MSNPSQKLALVLSAGGARAAYQVGVLKHLGAHLPQFAPKILSGLSAGSINAAYLAQGKPVKEATHQLYELWKNLKFENVMRTNFKTAFSIFQKVFYDVFFSRVTKQRLFTSLFDATPLSVTLLSHVRFSRISKAIQSGSIQALAVSTTNYNTGDNTIFFESHDRIEPWTRLTRTSVRTTIKCRHIMASCSIPILFEPVRLGDYFYGDGAIRFRFPLSAATHLGASHIFAIGMSNPGASSAPLPPAQNKPSLGLVAGVVLNTIFIDSLETDYEHLIRINKIAGEQTQFRPIEAYILSPSQDLGKLAQDYLEEVPFHFRQLLKASAMSATELGDMVSYLMFTGGYLRALMKLGETDAANHHDKIDAFLKSMPESAS